MPLYGRWKSKPPPATPLDPYRGLTQGLALLLALNESGGIPVDISNGIRGSSNNATWAATPYGPGLSFNGTSQYVNLGTNPGWSLTGPLTIAFLGNPAASATQIAVDLRSSGNNGPSFAVTSANVMQYTVGRGSAFTLNSSAAAVDGGWHLYAVTHASTAANGVAFYRDGVPWGTGTQSNFNNAYGGCLLGTNPLITTSWYGGSMALVAVWNRALSAQEHAWLASDPWQMFAVPTYWLYRGPVGAPALFQPWIYGDQIEANALG